MQKISKLAVLFALLGSTLAVQGSIKDKLNGLAQVGQTDDSTMNCSLGTLPALTLPAPCNLTEVIPTSVGAASFSTFNQ
jgi:hypothetical protein